ncbi:hypothetical protein BDB00DRAFT_754128 [Zychaea mexicana]|uniref:uncharacterized protein n=1 Tax=Zychaea mexicana TaxID=64656 RepID=UPI0022FDC5F4|nr:uncharacterized protein BDB00DRAFT_754128 [Zychaea mexicana]KAI9499082.1 hypothetical protein BDB00DRAFT_754128 [Zychaea mexicana]
MFTILFVQAVTVSILEGFRVHQTVSQSSKCILSPAGVGASYTNLIYRGLVIAMAVYQLLLCVDTLRQRLAAQLYVLILFGLLFVIFVGIQALIQNESLEEWMIELGCDDELAHSVAPPYEYAILAIVAACNLVFLACSIWLHGHFTWHYHGGLSPRHQLSPSSSSECISNKRLKKAAVSLSTLLALIKLDLFFCFSFAAQLSPSALLNYYTTTMEALLVGALGFVLFTIACYAIQQERPWVLGIMTVLAALSIVYFVFRLITIAQPRLTGQNPYRVSYYFLLYTQCTLKH